MIRLNNQLCKGWLLLMATATLASCNTEEAQTQRKEQPQAWHVSIQAGKPNDNATRSLKKSDEVGTALTAYWSGSETFEVYKGDVKLEGTLTAQASEDGSTILTGTLSGADFSTSDELTIFSPSKDRDYSVQTGDEAGISAKNYIQATVSVNAVDNSNGILSTSQADFSYRQSFTKFTFDQNVTSVTISAAGLTNSPITVTPASATNTLYVAMENTTGSKVYDITASVGGNPYIGAKSANITNGSYYTADISLTPTAQVGDYFYADGTWSTVYDNSHGAVIGLVFSTDVAEADKAAGFTHGYVVALNNVDNVYWSTSNFLTGMDVISADGKTDDEWLAAIIADLDGLSHCNFLKEHYPDTYSSTFPALNAALTYTPTASKTTYNNSGWFLPSTGQLYAFLYNFCTKTIAWPDASRLSYRDSFSTHEWAIGWAAIGDKTSSALYNYFYQRLNTDIVSRGGAAVSFTAFPAYGSSGSHNYWSSTEFNASGAYMYHFGGSGNSVFMAYCDYTQKTYFYSCLSHMRPILAF